MNGHQAKKLREICFDAGLYGKNREKLMAMDPDIAQARIHSAQCSLYMRAKKVYSQCSSRQRRNFIGALGRIRVMFNQQLILSLEEEGTAHAAHPEK